MSDTRDITSQTYANQTIFLTGGTGFCGKAIIEKLLRSTPDVAKIYVLIRPRNDVAVVDRLEQNIIRSPIFDRLRQEHGSDAAGGTFLRSKLCAVAGDVTLPMLGLSPNDQQRLRASVQISIHSAATVRFDEPLDVAVRMNCTGAMHALAFVQSCPQLQCHMHVSTAYVNSNHCRGDRTTIREELYPLAFDVDDVLSTLATDPSPAQVQALYDNVIGAYPNTYALTKAMAEHLVVRHARTTLPLVILRPTIVGAAWQEPTPGWVDQVAGGGALFLAVGMGVLTIMPGDTRNVVDLVPVDLVVHTALVAIAYALTRSNDTVSRPVIVHCGTSDVRANPVEYGLTTRVMLDYFRESPPVRGIFKPQFRMIRSRTAFRLAWFAKYKIRLAALQAVAELSRSERLRRHAAQLEKLTSRARALVDVFRPLVHCWIFQSDNVRTLQAFVGPEDHAHWWLDARAIDWTQWTRNYCMGLKKYILKEDGIERQASPLPTL